ncbi:MAG TPA: outer membrane beta-barrel protein [Steroidobacteraceae bacterium]|nr:outer membrane beta-barrel protein [Steroidobacteraceae bacterium]
MKNISVVLLAAITLAFAGLADAAPKKRTRNANRIGPYGMGFIGQSSWTSDQSGNEQDLVDTLVGTENPFQNMRTSTSDTDIGYNATFGFRFNRYFAAELGLAQFGSVESKAQAEMDFGEGFEPVELKLAFSAGGPLMSVVGIIPVSDKFEVYGRVGYLFTSSERELTSKVSGQSGGFGSAKGDSQDLVYGAGVAWHFNQVYSVRLEYQQLDELGQENRSGLEDLNVIGLGVMVRF